MGALIIVIGHVAIGLLFGLYTLSDMKQVEADKKRFMEDSDHSRLEKDVVMSLVDNKGLLLTFYTLIGYFHFYYVAKRLVKRLYKKGA